MQKLLFNCFALLLIFSTNHLAAQTNKIRIFQFNIWNEANKIKNGTNKIADVIAKSDADIITFSEVRNKKGDWHQKIIQKLKDRGKTYFGEYGGGDVGLISRYPVTKTESI
ncbi:MAG: endonuclease/exonuclease/phosphatase family protein, partial [Lentisphaeraceae bacterium]|nr:endonuclease/exonuclease/phosphatase family protein [Lentisphaeraceae bacterium]